MTGEPLLEVRNLKKHFPIHTGLFSRVSDRVYAVDANAYFARPGPRVVAGTELLAHLIHPEIFGWRGPAGAFQKLEPAQMRRG